MRTIFDETKLGNLRLKNRVIRSATWEAMALPNGGPSDEQVKVYEELAKGGVGAIITGFTSVDKYDNYFNGMARLSSDDLINGWKKVAEAAHSENVPIIMQLAMGEYVRNRTAYEPDNLSSEQIREITALFGDAARRAKNAGYDGVQIHAAHNFYLSRFISPAFNHRSDEYGGNTEKRAKILVDVLHDMRLKAPELHITMKINCSDFMRGGLTSDEALNICLLMEKSGLDSVEVSGNGTSVGGIKAGQNEGYFLPFAKELKKYGKLPIILVGGHRSIECMNKIVDNEEIEFLSMSRPLIREPDLMNRWKNGDLTPSKCVSCNMCYRTPGHKCAFI